MIIHFGYVATPKTLDNITYSKKITYKTYSNLSKENQKDRLNAIINENLKNFNQIITYNHINQISFYRISPDIIPLATHDDVNFNYLKYKDKFKEIGNRINNYNMRLDTHLNQYCILNSQNESVVKNAIEGINYHYNLFKMLNINGKAILHIGSGKDNKEESINRFITNFNKLPIHLKNIIILENDDKIFTFEDTLSLCQKLKIPMVLDYHHYKCNKRKKLTKQDLIAIYNTWENTNLKPKIHFSSPKSSKEKRSHNDYIKINDFLKFLNLLKEVNQDVDIMLECKMRDIALFKLTRQLRFYNLKALDNTTFEI